MHTDRTLRVNTKDGTTAPELRLHTAYLVVLDGPAAGRRYPVNGRVLRLGSEGANDIVLTDTSVSRNHAIVEDLEEGFRLRDLGSTNGTWVNGIRAQEVFLAPGVTVKLGNARVRFEVEQTSIGSQAWARDIYHGMVGRSLVMRHLFGFLNRVASTELSVLLLGETGTGKEEAARALHAASPRSAGPFVVFDGATTETNLMGATLFGQKEGAFTGATKARLGSFQAANGGTLFIDEVGDIPVDLQPKLLRALERREVQPLGADTVIKVDVRVVAATHRNLDQMVNEGTFREDLYYRLSGVVLELPPLRERREDIPPLAERFLDAIGGDKALGSSALEVLNGSEWPGNVRQLRNVLQRAASLCPGAVIEAEHMMTGAVRFTPKGAVPRASTSIPVMPRSEIPATAAPLAPETPADKPLSLDEREKHAILEVLGTTDWNMTLAAEILGITRQTLRRKLIQFGIQKPDGK